MTKKALAKKVHFCDVCQIASQIVRNPEMDWLPWIATKIAKINVVRVMNNAHSKLGPDPQRFKYRMYIYNSKDNVEIVYIVKELY